MLQSILENMQEDMKSYHRSRKFLERYYVQLRLNKSLSSYYADLSTSVRYLGDRNVDNVLRYL